MELSARLDMLVKLVRPCKTVADIGCDHGYTAIRLIQDKKAERVVACDINQGPLSRARDNVSKHGLDEMYVELRLGDGLAPIRRGEVELLLISGMGGGLVIDILRDGSDVMEESPNLVLQPQKDIPEVRRYLHSINYRITDEDMVYENGKYYTAIAAERAKESYDNEIYYQYGKPLIDKKHEILMQYIESRLINNRCLANKLSEHETTRACERLSMLNDEWKMGMEVMRCITR